MSFHQFTDSQGNQYGSFEVFYSFELYKYSEWVGWYWHACFPGCLPDGDPSGPFESEDDAITDANS